MEIALNKQQNCDKNEIIEKKNKFIETSFKLVITKQMLENFVYANIQHALYYQHIV